MGKNNIVLILKNLRFYIIDLLFPVYCIACGKEGASFCIACRRKIPVHGNFEHNGIFFLWGYRHPQVRKALLALKYKNKRSLAEDIADSLYDTLLEQLSEKSLFLNPNFPEPYILIPIPLSKQRFKNRGYNQAELLARTLFQKDKTFFVFETSVLYKTKDTEAQVSVKDRVRRLKNIQHAFSVQNPERIRGKNILLIDDITTTGATLEEARRVLLKAGARIVYGVAVAH